MGFNKNDARYPCHETDAHVTQEDLVLVFSPPLASMLGLAERQKGAPLTEDECNAVRDKSQCIAMHVEKAEIIEKKFGFKDVNPDNCFSDWNSRLRAEITNGYLPKIIMCVPTMNDDMQKFEAIAKEEEVEYELTARDDRLAESFRSADSPTQPSLTDHDIELIKEHTGVFYFLGKNMTASQAPEGAAKMMRIGKRLLDAGGVAIKCESSGLAHSKRRWLELTARLERGIAKGVESTSEIDFWLGLFLAYVQLPIRFGDDLYSCGMHLLGKPDMVATSAQMKESMRQSGSQASPIHETIKLFDEFALYILAECPEGTFGNGHTFSVEEDAPKFAATWEKCTDYEESDFFFNPFGRWRFLACQKD